jgi:hypothetical protein
MNRYEKISEEMLQTNISGLHLEEQLKAIIKQVKKSAKQETQFLNDKISFVKEIINND